MKKFVSLLLAFSLALCLAACGGSASSAVSGSAASSEAASSEAASSEAAASSAAAQESTIASTRQERAGPFLPFLCARLHPGHECAILKEKTTGRDNA